MIPKDGVQHNFEIHKICYLVMTITSNSEEISEVNDLIAKLEKSTEVSTKIFKSQNVSRNSKLSIYKTMYLTNSYIWV